MRALGTLVLTLALAAPTASLAVGAPAGPVPPRERRGRRPAVRPGHRRGRPATP